MRRGKSNESKDKEYPALGIGHNPVYPGDAFSANGFLSRNSDAPVAKLTEVVLPSTHTNAGTALFYSL
jgi:hypothetical protein